MSLCFQFVILCLINIRKEMIQMKLPQRKSSKPKPETHKAEIEPHKIVPQKKVESDNSKNTDTNANQITRFDGLGCFFEVLKGGFHLQKNNCIGKVHFNFVEYDRTTYAQKNLLRCYMDIDKWLAWEKQWKTGDWNKDIEAARKKQAAGNYPYRNPIRISLGGGHENGVLYSRQIKITPGNKRYTDKDTNDKSLIGKLMPEEVQPLVISCEYALGELSKTGLPIPKGKPITTIRVPLTHEQVDALFEMTHIQIQAYYNAQVINGLEKAQDKELEEVKQKLVSLEKETNELKELLTKTYERLVQATSE